MATEKTMTIGEFKECYGTDSDTNMRKRCSKTKIAQSKKFRARDAAYAKFKKDLDGHCDLDRIPKPEDVPAGMGIVHNHIVPPARRIGARGFRIWVQALDDSDPPLEICPCKWAPELGRHYRVQLQKNTPLLSSRPGGEAADCASPSIPVAFSSTRLPGIFGRPLDRSGREEAG
jgi:hypothetical protein